MVIWQCMRGLLIGNHKFVHKRSSLKFFGRTDLALSNHCSLPWGYWSIPSELLPIAGVALLIGFFMTLISRPAAVFIGLSVPQNVISGPGFYVSWVGLRGAAYHFCHLSVDRKCA